MRKESKAKVAAAQRALEKCFMGHFTVSPYRSKIEAAPGDVRFDVINPEKREIYVYRAKDGCMFVYGEIGLVPGSRPCGVTPETAHYRGVHFDENGCMRVLMAS